VRAAVIALLASTGTAFADDAPPIEVSGGLSPTVAIQGGSGAHGELFGALAPAVDVGYQPQAVERDRWAYGAAASRASLGLSAGMGDLTALAFVLVGAPQDGKSTVDLDRAIVRWKPKKYLALSAGRDSVPLSAQSATPTAALLFPSRVPVADRFALVTQAGAQAQYLSDVVTVSAGVWNGVSNDITGMMPVDERGPLFSARVEVTPMGEFAFDENAGRGPLKVGIGLGATYRAASTYLADGSAASRSRDLRAGLSLRVGMEGMLVETEILRRQVTDDLSMRPEVDTAYYVQASYRIHVDKAQIAPLARVGWLWVRELSAPALGSSLELGVAAFPIASEKLRITGMYQRLSDPDLGTSHHGVAQLRFAF
jgi:hypothetical protein